MIARKEHREAAVFSIKSGQAIAHGVQKGKCYFVFCFQSRVGKIAVYKQNARGWNIDKKRSHSREEQISASKDRILWPFLGRQMDVAKLDNNDLH